ncbi:MAG: preprotein translocase subunit YajC [Novosphingobium sp.]
MGSLVGFLSIAASLALPFHAQAKTSTRGGNSAASADGEEGSADAKPARHGRAGKKISITPYIEAAQVATAQLSPVHDTVTYTTLAVGADLSAQGRNTQAAASLRYERRIGYGKSASADVISGVARVSAAVVPHVLTIEGGALATRTRIDGNGSSTIGTPLGNGNSAQLYSLYAGPTLTTHAGDVAVTGRYMLGYTQVGTDNGIVTTPGGPAVDVFDHSLAHDAQIHAGVRAGEVLPVGLGVGGGFYQEDISNLDQRVRDINLRADVTLPVSSDIALVGGVGYEDVTVSSRDALRDGAGNPVIGSNGRYVTDTSAPRRLAYDTSGLTWDAGVMWRPSRRTALEAHVGRRYGTISYYGSFAYSPNSRSSLNVAVYDNVSGFGGQLNRALAGMPTQFEAARNPLTGDLGTCLVSLEKGNCLGGALGSVRSATFRGRGVMASYGVDLGRLQAGIGAGYDRRKFIAAPGTVLASANGLTDENWWVAANLSARLDARSSFAANVWAKWFDTSIGVGGSGSAFGASGAYNRNLSDNLTATAALGIEGINQQALADVWSASALLGVRYSF